MLKGAISMIEDKQCPKCGSNLPASALGGICPKCLMMIGLKDKAKIATEDSPVIEGPGTKIDRYELLELIGEGGMGLVYLSEQKEPVKRKVALKIVKLGIHTRITIYTSKLWQRFSICLTDIKYMNSL
jgi:hypothetical protein